METLTADKGKVLAAYEKAKSGKKVLLENIFGPKTFQPNVIERIKSFDDVLRELGKPKSEFKKEIEGLSENTIAFEKAKLVCLAYNEGWFPDWSNSSQYKYTPYFKWTSSPSGGGFSFNDDDDWCTFSGVGSRLCFETREKCEAAAKLFKQEIYKPLFN